MNAGRDANHEATTVGYQGAPGANGERAIAARWGDEARPVPLRSFPLLLEAVAAGRVDYGVVPVWNSTMGAVREPSEALATARGRVEQVGEVTVPVRHALLGLPGSSLESVYIVASHPAALAQCRGFLAQHPRLAAVPAWDTAGAVVELAALASGAAVDGPPWYAGVQGVASQSLAVLANESLADEHGLAVLARDVQDDPRNATRFAVVRARPGGLRW